MNRVAFSLFLALLAAPTAWAQVPANSGSNISYAGPPGSPGATNAMQGAFPGAQVSSAQSLPPTVKPAINPSEAALIGRGTPIPIGVPSPDGTTLPDGTVPAEPVEEKIYPESPAEIAARQAAMWEAGAASQALRQKGLTMGQGDRYFGSIAASPAEKDKVVLARWKAWLPQFGADPAKIEDESRRLPRLEFDAWASRFVWFSCSNHPAATRPLGCAHLGN